MTEYVLLIDCNDSKGLIHAITGVLLDEGLNIMSNKEFVERRDNKFFMRTRFAGKINKEEVIQKLKTRLPSEVNIQLNKLRKKDVVILATREHHCLSDLLVRHHFGELKANVKAVISNHQVLEDLVRRFDIPFHHISNEGLKRTEHEEKLLEVIHPYTPEYIVLAKYMRILTPYFVEKFHNRIVNIHHSFLPAFAGANPYLQAYERGVKIIGATAHFVNEDLDEGPIIAQNVIPVGHSQSAPDMAQAGRDVEKIVLAKSLKMVFEDRVFVHRNKTVIFD